MQRIRVVMAAANAVKSRPLDLDEEQRRIVEKIRMSEFRDAIEFIPRFAARPDDLMQALLEHKPAVLHFSGHGHKELGIVFQGDGGRLRPVDQKTLVHLLGQFKHELRLVLLNACETATHAEAIAQEIEFAVGMIGEITDAAAIVFAASFYRAIGFGRTVREAFELGRSSILLEGAPGFEIPRLFERPGSDASRTRLIEVDFIDSGGVASATPSLSWKGHPSTPQPVRTPMPKKGEKLISGRQYQFVCLQIDIAGHSGLDAPQRVLHEMKSAFATKVRSAAAEFGAVTDYWAGDGGWFLYHVTDGIEYEKSVLAAFRVLDMLPLINREIRMETQFTQDLAIRISLDAGQAVYSEDAGIITGHFLNVFFKHERDFAWVGTVTASERVYQELRQPLKDRLPEKIRVEKANCFAYRSRSESPAVVPPPAPPSGPTRERIVVVLSSLVEADFETVVALIPGAANQVGAGVPIGVRAARLINWAQGPTGPPDGLGSIVKALKVIGAAVD